MHYYINKANADSEEVFLLVPVFTLKPPLSPPVNVVLPGTASEEWRIVVGTLLDIVVVG